MIHILSQPFVLFRGEFDGNRGRGKIELGKLAHLRLKLKVAGLEDVQYLLRWSPGHLLSMIQVSIVEQV